MPPIGWAKPKLRDIVEFNPKHSPNTDKDQLISFVPMNAVDEHLGQITNSTDRPLREVWTGYTHFADNDVIFAKITPCMENGKAAVVRSMTNGLACGSTEFYVFRSTNAILPDYLWRYVRHTSFREESQRHMSGAVGQQRVPRDYLEDYNFPLPPLAEQRRIVVKLEALTARLARASADLECVKMLSKKLKQQALSDLAYGRNELEQDAKFVPLKKVIANLRTGPFGSSVHKADYISGGTPLINPMHINDGKIKFSSSVTIGPEKLLELLDFRLSAGDVILARRGEMGRCAVVREQEEGWLIGTGSMALTPNDDLSPEYLQLFLSSPPVVAALEASAVGSTMVNLNQGILLNLTIRLPSIEVQARLVAKLRTIFERADRLAAESNKAKIMIDRLESAILAKAFKGELVPQDPNDEPASVLLARIRAQREATAKVPGGRGGRRKVR